MRAIYLPIAAVGLISLIVCDLNRAANLPPVKGGVLPLITLPVPEDPDEKEYLGLSGSGFFTIPQIKAKVVIIEIFSLYCPKCQKIAPGIDKLYYLIESDPGLRNKIKLIGIGAGNSRYEVDVFRKTFNTPFPFFQTTISPSIKPWETSGALTSSQSGSTKMGLKRSFIRNWTASKKPVHFWS